MLRALKPFLNPHWYLDSNGSMKIVNCLPSNFSKMLEITGKMLTGRSFSSEPLYPVFKKAVIFAFFKKERSVDIFVDSLKNPQI